MTTQTPPTPPSQPTEMPVRASQILRVRKIWMVPMILAAVFVALMSVIYVGSVIDPTAHLHDLPVRVVDQDGTGGQGARLVSALEGSPAVTDRLQLRNVTLEEAQATMDRGKAYATFVIPAGFDGNVQLLENQRLGSLGVNLAAGVLTRALGQISSSAHLAQPVTMAPTTYRPLPDHAALGLSAFYVALLAIMSGFVGATLINSSIDSALGYGATELGPRWRQRRPVPINRRQTLLVKWGVALLAAPILTGILLLVATTALGMYAPHILLLWALTASAALMISAGTLALLATFGSIGQLLAMILLVYLSLASSGGTVPIEALPGLFGVVGHVEPLRQVLEGTRAIMYFGARGDAGLTHSLVLIACELAFWLLVGLAVTSWYDHRRLYRMAPEVFATVERAIDQAVAERKQAASAAEAVSS